jgi:porphobilinogen synthase
MAFPVTRLRRLRRTAELRNLVCETRLTPDAFVYRCLCARGGVRRSTLDAGRIQFVGGRGGEEAQEVHSLGVPSVILFGLPDKG